MINIKEIKETLEIFIERKLNESISLLCDIKNDVGIKLEFLPEQNIYIISKSAKILNKTCVYKSKDLELAMKEYYNILEKDMSKISEILGTLYSFLKIMNAKERLDVFEKIQEDYCQCCGYEKVNNECVCWRDE